MVFFFKQYRQKIVLNEPFKCHSLYYNIKKNISYSKNIFEQSFHKFIYFYFKKNKNNSLSFKSQNIKFLEIIKFKLIYILLTLTNINNNNKHKFKKNISYVINYLCLLTIIRIIILTGVIYSNLSLSSILILLLQPLYLK